MRFFASLRGDRTIPPSRRGDVTLRTAIVCLVVFFCYAAYLGDQLKRDESENARRHEISRLNRATHDDLISKNTDTVVTLRVEFDRLNARFSALEKRRKP